MSGNPLPHRKGTVKQRKETMNTNSWTDEDILAIRTALAEAADSAEQFVIGFNQLVPADRRRTESALYHKVTNLTALRECDAHPAIIRALDKLRRKEMTRRRAAPIGAPPVPVTNSVNDRLINVNEVRSILSLRIPVPSVYGWLDRHKVPRIAATNGRYKVHFLLSHVTARAPRTGAAIHAADSAGAAGARPHNGAAVKQTDKSDRAAWVRRLAAGLITDEEFKQYAPASGQEPGAEG